MLKTFIVAGLCLMLLVQSAGIAIAQDEESFVRRAVISKKDALVLSMIYPGLGQMTAGQKYKGMSLFVAETVSLVFFINAHENYNTKQKVYDRDLDNYAAIATKGSGEYKNALTAYKDLQDTSDELDNLHTIRNTALIVAGAVYAYNIFDAIFFSASKDGSMRAERQNRMKVSSTIIDRTPGILLSKSF